MRVPADFPVVGGGSAASGGLRAVAYLRVSTESQGESRGGLDAQRSVVDGWSRSRVDVASLDVFEEAASGSTLVRPVLEEVLGGLQAGRWDVLVVSKLDRLSRSVIDFARLLERARRQGWQLVALDIGVDMTTSSGELVANMLAALAQWERRVIGERTRAALAEKRAQGVVLGRPREVAWDVVELMVGLYVELGSFGATARRLNELGVPTPRGSSWYARGVQRTILAASPGVVSRKANGVAKFRRTG